MISKQQQKYVQSLHNKKYRTENERFLVEGEKSILELLNSDFEVEIVFCSPELAAEIDSAGYKVKVAEGSGDEIGKISTLKNNSSGVAVVRSKSNRPVYCGKDEIILVLDDIRDPGNLGTIIRLADWYGLKNIVCSEETVEFYNPKVIASTMGSFTRVHCYYTSLATYFEGIELPLTGTFLEGQNVHEFIFPPSGYLVIGSESHGISDVMKERIDFRVTIPRFGLAESLNAANATAIVLDNLKRNK